MIKQNSPHLSVSFNQAVCQPQPLQIFDGQFAHLVAENARNTVNKRQWRVVKKSDYNGGHFWISSGDRIAYAKKRYATVSPDHLMEKMVTDIGHELGLPICTTAFSQINHSSAKENCPILISAADSINAPVLSKKTGGFSQLLAENNLNQQAFVALSLFDLWVCNWDHHEANFSFTKNGQLVSFDYDNLQHIEGAEINPRQRDVLQKICSPDTVGQARRVFESIINYPDNVILEKAQKMSFLGGQTWHPDQKAEMLIKQKSSLPALISRFIPYF